MREVFELRADAEPAGRPVQRGRGAPAQRGLAAALAGNPAQGHYRPLQLARAPGERATSGSCPPWATRSSRCSCSSTRCARSRIRRCGRTSMHAVTNGLGALPAVAAKWRYGMPMIVTEHGVYMREHYLHLPPPAVRLAGEGRCTCASCAACARSATRRPTSSPPATSTTSAGRTELGADAARIRTVYNGVDPADLPGADRASRRCRPSPGLGRIDPIKDLETLLRAFSLVVNGDAARPGCAYSAPRPRAGQAYLERCRAEAADLGLTGQATFEGRVSAITGRVRGRPSVRPVQHQRGLPLHPHRGDGLRAGQRGHRRRRGQRGGRGRPGWSCRPRNPAALAEACLRLLRDDTLRQAMGAAARAAGPGALHRGPRDRRVRRDVHGSGLGRGLGSPDAVVTEPDEQTVTWTRSPPSPTSRP